jgi:hypothetical protein
LVRFVPQHTLRVIPRYLIKQGDAMKGEMQIWEI